MSSKKPEDGDSPVGSFRNPDTSIRLGLFSIEGQSHTNEDRVFAVDDLRYVPNLPPTQVNERISFASVFDGHGGDRCSEYLSRNLHLKAIVSARFTSFASAALVLEDAFRACEEEWNAIAESEEEFSGSCAIAALIMGNSIVLAHAGDCRAVARIGKSTVQLTKDHRPSDPAEKARIYAAGGVIKGGRVMGVLAPSRGFGDLDVKRKAPSPLVVVSTPDINTYTLDLVRGLPTFVILATDGIWDAMSPEKACDVVGKSLAKHNDEEAAARKLCQVAAELNSDDCSCVVVLCVVVHACLRACD